LSRNETIARIEQGPAVVENQHRHLAEGIEAGRDRIRLPRIVVLELVVDLFFCEHDAHLACERAGKRADQFHFRKLSFEKK